MSPDIFNDPADKPFKYDSLSPKDFPMLPLSDDALRHISYNGLLKDKNSDAYLSETYSNVMKNEINLLKARDEVYDIKETGNVLPKGYEVIPRELRNEIKTRPLSLDLTKAMGSLAIKLWKDSDTLIPELEPTPIYDEVYAKIYGASEVSE